MSKIQDSAKAAEQDGASKTAPAVEETPILGKVRTVIVTASSADAHQTFSCGISNRKVSFNRVGLPYGKPVQLPQAVIDLLKEEKRTTMQRDPDAEGGFRMVSTPANHIEYVD